MENISTLEYTAIAFVLAAFAAICAENSMWYLCGALTLFAVISLAAAFFNYCDGK